MSAQKSKSKSQTKKDPFKTRKTRSAPAGASADVEAPPEVMEAIDRFRELQDQAKHFEGEATVYKDQVLEFAQQEYAKRYFNGQSSSFKILGHEAGITYVVMDSSAGLTEEDVSAFAERWGEQAAEALITRDFRSIRFDPKVLEANYDLVVEALQVLPEDVLENLFKPMLMMAKPGALELTRTFAKNQDDFLEMLEDLKMKNYIR